MIELNNVNYKIKHKWLLEDVSLVFPEGKFSLILGPNGAGKSTLIKTISGELKPSTGNVWFGEIPMNSFSVEEIAKFRSVLSQNTELSFPLNAEEVVMMGRYPHFKGTPRKEDVHVCDEVMSYFEIDHLRNRNYLTLSGGEKQRVQFARVFSQIWLPSSHRRLLLLDEPLTFLDVFYQFDLMDKIKEFMSRNSDVTVIGVVHDIKMAINYADYVLLMHNARIYDFGLTKNVLTTQAVKEVFRVDLERIG